MGNSEESPIAFLPLGRHVFDLYGKNTFFCSLLLANLHLTIFYQYLVINNHIKLSPFTNNDCINKLTICNIRPVKSS